VSEKLRATLVDMKKAAGGDAERPKVAWATMLKLVGNVVKVCSLGWRFLVTVLRGCRAPSAAPLAAGIRCQRGLTTCRICLTIRP
jgi:hypothetical protein